MLLTLLDDRLQSDGHVMGAFVPGVGAIADQTQIPERRTYTYIVTDFIAQGAESMRVIIEGMNPATLRAGVRRALKGKLAEGVRMAQRGEDTYLVRRSAD